MEFVLNQKRPNAAVSVILIDWGVRESFHSLYYLNRQTVPRDKYDLIWVEFYDRKPEALARAVEEFGNDSPALDKWIVLGYGADCYFHKHRAYNVGIAAADGGICVICDSDAMFSPTFIEKVIRGIQENPHAYLHLDEVRNNSRRFYPFNFPGIEEVLERDCINWTGETTFGLNGSRDLLHDANYGACFVARRDDLIGIGGADEHVDYLGYICGPYELSFRLRNAGFREVWLRDEYLYHTWHPGESGINLDYQGPSDGRGIAQRALEARDSGRVLPYRENPALQAMRLGHGTAAAERSLLLDAETDGLWKSIAEQFRASRRVRLVQAGFHGFDLYSYAEHWYAVAIGEGTFDPEKAQQGSYSPLFSAPTLSGLKRSVRRYAWRVMAKNVVRRFIAEGSSTDQWLRRRLSRRSAGLVARQTRDCMAPQGGREDGLGFKVPEQRSSPARSALATKVVVGWLLLRMLRKQLAAKRQMGVLEHDGAPHLSVDRVVRPRSLKDMILAPARKPLSFLRFIRRMLECDRRLISGCLMALNDAKRSGREIVLYGNEEATRVLSTLARRIPVQIHALCRPEPSPAAKLHGIELALWSEEHLPAWPGTVVVSAFVNVEMRIRRLLDLGIPSERLVAIQLNAGEKSLSMQARAD